MPDDKAEPPGDFETWLLHRVAQAVEAGEISVELLTGLQTEIEAAGVLAQEKGEAAASRQIAELLGISEERAAKALAAIDAGSPTARDRLLRGIAEAWLKGHQETYRRRRRAEGT